MLLGTAGHVDHGKSTLVEALTGINPMHLPEEHRRELTIELGFAHLKHPDGYTIGVVDVPGHEKLVKTMISGASGFEIALWVVDAREGLMPQSLEHLDVLNLLSVRNIIPVITKIDLASENEVRETTRSIQQRLDRPVQLVDSVSRRGISELKERIFNACRTLHSDPARTRALAYMPVDRCFVLKGVGTVVTGTLVRGELHEGDVAAISSRPETYRVRSLHNHNTTVNFISAGHRVGVHLHGIKVDDVQRGDTLVAADYPYRSRSVNVELELLNGSTFRWKPGLRAHFLAASFEMECRIWGLVRSNGKIRAQLQLPQEACFYPDQRFILRSTNPLKTIGGGIVVDVAPDRPRRVTEPEQDRGRYLELSRPAVFKVASLARKWMCEEEEITGDELRRSAGLVWHTKLDLLAVGKLNELIAKAKDQTAEWSFSMLAGMLKIKTEFMHDYLRQLLESHFKGVLSLTSSSLRFDPRRGELSDPEQSVAENVVRKLLAARLQPLRVTEYLTAAAVDKKTFDKALARLLKDGRVIRIDNEFVVERSIWEEFKKHVQGHAAAGFTASEFGKEFGLSRKYSVPYLECLNRFGVLRRQGDRHMILRARRET